MLSRLGFIALLGLALFQAINEEFPVQQLSASLSGWQDRLTYGGEDPANGLQKHESQTRLAFYCQPTTQRKAVFCVRHYQEVSTRRSGSQEYLTRRDTFLVAHINLHQSCPQTVDELPPYTQEILAEIEMNDF